MDEGIEGKARALRDLKVMAGIHIAVMKAAEKSMVRMHRGHVWRMWFIRSLVLLNVTLIAYDWSCFPQSFAWMVTPVNAWVAWRSFVAAEAFAGDLPGMRWALADVREKIKQTERMARHEG